MGFGKEGGMTLNERRSVVMSELSQMDRTFFFHHETHGGDWASAFLYGNCR